MVVLVSSRAATLVVLGSSSISSRVVAVGVGVGEVEVGVVGEERRGIIQVVEVGEEALQSNCFLSKGAYINTVGIYNHSEHI